jgi:hypothetical protein
MGKSHHKSEKINLNLKKIWEVPKGHQEHDQGCGRHNDKPRKQRTRRDEVRQAIRDSQRE